MLVDSFTHDIHLKEIICKILSKIEEKVSKIEVICYNDKTSILDRNIKLQGRKKF